MSGLPDELANFQTVTWTLTAEDGSTTLTMTEADLPFEDVWMMSEQGWEKSLGDLKALVEEWSAIL